MRILCQKETIPCKKRIYFRRKKKNKFLKKSSWQWRPQPPSAARPRAEESLQNLKKEKNRIKLEIQNLKRKWQILVFREKSHLGYPPLRDLPIQGSVPHSLDFIRKLLSREFILVLYYQISIQPADLIVRCLYKFLAHKPPMSARCSHQSFPPTTRG